MRGSLLNGQDAVLRMKCFYHKDRKSTRECSECGRFVCNDCSIKISSGVLCKDCVEKGVRKPEERAVKAETAKEKTERSPADLFQRVAAWVIDVVAMLILSIVLGGFAFGLNSNMMLALAFLFVGVTLIFDAILILAFGKTLGKAIVNIRVVEKDKEKVDRETAALRSLVKVPALLSIFWLPLNLATVSISVGILLVECVSIVLTKRAIHDFVAGTEVVSG